jgi:uncharacterized membrane protein YphA (DoxX/SURF4 family)
LQLLGGLNMTARAPRWVAAVLAWPGTWFVARLVLTGAYLLGGLTKLLNFSAAVAEQEHFGLHPGWFWATVVIVTELGGSLLIVLDEALWLGAGALAVLTLVASFLANDFWHLEGQARFMATNAFFEHLGLVAGFALAALHSSAKLRAADTSVPRRHRGVIC